MNDTHFDTIVVGAGLAGLTAATHASWGGGHTLLIEPHLIGGRARCDQREGVTFNRGPRALYLGGAAERELRAVGVDVTRGAAPLTHASQVWDGGELHLAPFDPSSAVRTHYLSATEKLSLSRVFLKIRRLDPATAVGTTVARWLDLHGITGRIRSLVEALTRVATYTNAPEVLDAGAALANVKAAMTPGVRYLDGGFQRLVDGLLTALAARDVTIERRTVAGVEPGSVALGDGVRLTAGTIVLATVTPHAAAVLLGGRPWRPLGPAAEVACLELGVARLPAVRFALGIDTPTYYSVHCPPARLAPEGCSVVHLMRYLAPGEHGAGGEVRAELMGICAAVGIAAEDIVTERFLANMTVSGAIPVATAGGLAGRPGIDASGMPGVLLAGDWVGGEGLLADAAVASGAAAGKAAAARVARAVTLAG